MLEVMIKEEADKYRSGVENGFLFGEPIDMNNTDMVLVAACCKVQRDEMQKSIRDMKFTMKLMAKV